MQIGKAMGATVIAIASTDEKREAARQAGADHVIGYDNLKETMRELAGKKGVDVIFDPVGGDTFDTLVRTMGRHGRYLVVGFAAGRIPQLPVNLALVKEFSLVGVFWGAFTQHEPAVYAEKCPRTLRLVSRRQSKAADQRASFTFGSTLRAETVDGTRRFRQNSS